jgi:hypothetical protein
MVKWFRAKLYGWGWTPATWQGWAVTIGFVLYIFNTYGKSHNVYYLIFPLAILIVICYLTGETPKWRWGK